MTERSYLQWEDVGEGDAARECKHGEDAQAVCPPRRRCHSFPGCVSPVRSRLFRASSGSD